MSIFVCLFNKLKKTKLTECSLIQSTMYLVYNGKRICTWTVIRMTPFGTVSYIHLL